MSKRKRHKQLNIPSVKRSTVAFSKSRLHLVEVDAFMRPLEAFIDHIKKESIWINEAGDAVIDLPHQGVEELVQKGISPPEALPSFLIMFETYFQVVAYCLDTAAIQRAHDQISHFRHTILNPLENDLSIEREAILQAEALLQQMKTVFISVPREKVFKVMHEIKLAIRASENESFKTEVLRGWLLKALEEKSSV
jgi:hypothetical protein